MSRTLREATAEDAPVAPATMAERIEVMGKRAIAAGAVTVCLIYETRDGFAIDAEPNTEAVRKGLASMAIDRLYPDAPD
jgi:hypothetical protein